jgi:hypothetical protein
MAGLWNLRLPAVTNEPTSCCEKQEGRALCFAHLYRLRKFERELRRGPGPFLETEVQLDALRSA